MVTKSHYLSRIGHYSSPLVRVGVAMGVCLASAFFSPSLCRAQAPAYASVPFGNVWRDKMVQAGKVHADGYHKLLQDFRAAFSTLRSAGVTSPSYQAREKMPSWNQALAAQYYDGGAVFYNNALLDPANAEMWNARGDEAVEFYRDHYVLPLEGRIPGYRNFCDGLLIHMSRMGQRAVAGSVEIRRKFENERELSRRAIALSARNAAYARDTTSDDTRDPILSREVAYAIRAMIAAEKVGEPRRERLQKLIADARHHLKVLVPEELPSDPKQAPYTRPFMVAITARALIDVMERDQTAAYAEELRLVADRMWRRMWDQNSMSMLYSNRDFPGQAAEEDRKPAPDLNMMIQPLYAWVWQATGDVSAKERADLLLRGALKGAYWDGAKQYNQQGWWGLDGIRYRARNPLVK